MAETAMLSDMLKRKISTRANTSPVAAGEAGVRLGPRSGEAVVNPASTVNLKKRGV